MSRNVRPSAEDFLTISPRIRVSPIIHGSGDCAILARDEMLARNYDCLAVPLPPSFQDEVEAAIESLPAISAVVRRDDDGEGYSYVPIDPCQGVVAAIRVAMQERIAREFVDMETPKYVVRRGVFPDPYALKRARIEAFSAALLPAIPRPEDRDQIARVGSIANRLHELERKYKSILLICSVLDWPWIREAYREPYAVEAAESGDEPVRTYPVDPKTLIFFLGELPFTTALYERSRFELSADDNLSIDGVKELALEARDRVRRERPKASRRATPHLLSVYFRYIRNLSLIERRLTPDLYTLISAAKEIFGDEFALAIAETARFYPYLHDEASRAFDLEPALRMGVDRGEIPGEGMFPMACRLPGQAISWRTCRLQRRPPEKDKEKWRHKWNPYGMCSWPPEDDRIESFQKHVRDRARATIGADLARSEKFQTSVKDGVDIRETLRNWHTGDIYVKVMPPDRGSIEVVVFLFDVPADPKKYVYRFTWFAEHIEESTLAFFATDPMTELVGPGIAAAEYGGAMFLYPPRSIPEIWTDRRLDFADTLEDRLLAAAFLHSKERHVAVVSPVPPKLSWRRLARRFGKKIVHLPLKRFSGALVDRLRCFHILNGKHVRSYAADFIRES
jgi:hypothetical protein